jgi:hypothetical protein
MIEMMDNMLQRYAAAFHEAGHAAVALDAGGWINHHGVFIDDNNLGHCGAQFRRIEYSVGTRIRYSLAGRLAERHWAGRPDNDRNYTCALEDLRDPDWWADRDPNETLGDDEAAVQALLDENPDIDEAGVLAAIAEHRSYLLKLFSRAFFWEKVERIALALLAYDKLDSEQVERIFWGE